MDALAETFDVPLDAEPALRALSELWSLEQLAGLFTRLSREADARGDHVLANTFDAIATAATERGLECLAVIEAVGLVATVDRQEFFVEIGSRQFPLPDLVPDLLRELLTAADVRRMETAMQTETPIPATHEQMNGEQPLGPGFVQRTIARLRLPTLWEVGAVASVALVGAAIYLAFGDVENTPAA